MKSNLVILFMLSCSTIAKVQTQKPSNWKIFDQRSDERSLALFIAPNRSQNLQQALELQVFPTGLQGHIYINLSIMAFVVVGYTIGGKFSIIPVPL